MHYYKRVFSSILFSLLLFSNTIYAQTEHSLPKHLGWLSLGMGRSSLNESWALNGSINFQVGHLLFAARTTGQYEYAFHLFEAGDELVEYGLLIGAATRSSHGHASFAIGTAFIRGTRIMQRKRKKIDPTFGFPVEAQLFLKVLKGIGIGFYLYGNINSERTFTGMTLSLQLGPLR